MKQAVLSILALLLLASCAMCAQGVYPEGELTRMFTLQTGEKADDTISVRNITDTAASIKIYQTDFIAFADGRTQYGEPGSVLRSNSSWITHTPHQLTVPAKSSVDVYYTVQVPKDNSLHGTYWSILMIEPSSDSEFNTAGSTAGKPNVGIRTIVRYAVKIVVHIGSSGTNEIKIANRQVVIKDSEQHLQIDVENTGERLVNPSIRLELYDNLGKQVCTREAEQCRILPGCSARQAISLTGVTSGAYNALVVFDNGDEYVWGAQYKLDVK